MLALYSTGVYLGGGLGLMIGGQIVDRWNAAYPPGTAPFGLVGWQAAYLLVGLPGLLLALWVRTLREPVRGAADGVITVPDARPMRAFLKELRAVVPPFTLWHLAREGAGSRAIVRNLALALALAALGFLLVRVTGDVPQWIALPIGIYAAVSWASTLGLRDRPCAALIFHTPTLRHLALGPLPARLHGLRAGRLGAGLLPPGARTADGRGRDLRRAHRGRRGRAGRDDRRPAGGSPARIAARGPPLRRPWSRRPVCVPLAWWMLSTPDVRTAYVLNFPVSMFASMWIGVGASTVQDLVLPRMRSVASAFYILVITFVGFALGPYCIGALSDALGDLGQAMRLSLLANVVAMVFLWRALRTPPARRSDAARAGARRRRARALIESARAAHLLLSRRLPRWARRRLVGLARLGPRRALSAARPRGRRRRRAPTRAASSSSSTSRRATRSCARSRSARPS